MRPGFFIGAACCDAAANSCTCIVRCRRVSVVFFWACFCCDAVHPGSLLLILIVVGCMRFFPLVGKAHNCFLALARVCHAFYPVAERRDKLFLQLFILLPFSQVFKHNLYQLSATWGLHIFFKGVGAQAVTVASDKNAVAASLLFPPSQYLYACVERYQCYCCLNKD